MEFPEYEKMYEAEQGHWWYRGLRNFFAYAVDDLDLNSESAILDAGCGTGANLQFLREKGYCNLYGFDFSDEAVRFCRQRGLLNVTNGNINHIPYEDSKFDFVLCSDVFECTEVDVERAYNELLRVLKPTGTLLINIAAFQSLLSEHDRAVHSVRRYTKKSALKSFKKNGVFIKMKYLFFSTFVFIAGFRLLKNLLFSVKKPENPKSDLRRLPGFLNEFMYYIVLGEVKLSRLVPLPWGTSLMLEIHKKV